MKAEQVDFISSYLPLARKAGESFRINPVVILAQAVIESGWGQSDLAREHHNFFGITAYGKKNVWWKGEGIELGVHSLRFRVYDTPQDSFMDYARLIRHAEVNGDNREAYRILLIKLCRQIEKISQIIIHKL